MNRKNTDNVELAIAHARLKLAEEMLRWSMNEQSEKLIPRAEWTETLDKIHEWFRVVGQKLFDVKTLK